MDGDNHECVHVASLFLEYWFTVYVARVAIMDLLGLVFTGFFSLGLAVLCDYMKEDDSYLYFLSFVFALESMACFATIVMASLS